MGSSYRKSAFDTLVVGFGTLITSLVALVQMPLLTKTLGAQAYGLWSQVQSTIGLIMPFAGLGLTIAMVRFLAAEKEREQVQDGFYSVASLLAMVSMVASLVLAVFARPIAVNFFDGDVLVVRITAAYIFISSVTPAYLSLIRAFQQVSRYTIFTTIHKCLQIGVFVYLVVRGYGIITIILGMLGVDVCMLAVLFFMVESRIGIKIPHFSRIKDYLRFGLPTVPRSIGFWVIFLSDRYVISFFLGVTSVGFYSAAYAVGSLPYTILSIITFVLLATLSQLYDDGRIDEVKTHLSYTLKYYLAIVIPFIFGAAIVGEPVLRLFSTAEIAHQGRFVIPIIAGGFLCLGITNIVSHVLILTKNTKVLGSVWIAAAAINLGLNIILVPRIGILGAAATSLFAFVLTTVAVCYYSFKEFKFSVDWLFIVKSLSASVIMAVAVWAMSPEGWVKTILTVVAGVVIYGVILLLFRGFNKDELRFFRGLLRRSGAG